MVRAAVATDAEAMSGVLRAIIAVTGRARPSDPDYVRVHYLSAAQDVRCSVAVDASSVLGFQSLIRAVPGNRYDVPDGWGIIGTHIDPRAHRRGVGTALFNASRAAARAAHIERIDAYIAADNAGALAYYEAMGFSTYRTSPGIVQKVYRLTS
jgi:ribosomal protein S18 acetylase RimI-like enzyme